MDLAAFRFHDVGEILLLDLSRRIEDVVQDLTAIILLADGVEVRANFGPLSAHAVTIATLHSLDFEEELSTTSRVAGQGKNLLRPYHGAQALHALFLRQKSLEQIAHLQGLD